MRSELSMNTGKCARVFDHCRPSFTNKFDCFILINKHQGMLFEFNVHLRKKVNEKSNYNTMVPFNNSNTMKKKTFVSDN